MSPVALWLPFEVDDLDQASGFYTDQVGLSVVDGWNRPGERGIVLAAGAAYVELVSPGRRPAPPGRAPEARDRGQPACGHTLAFQLTTASDVDETGRRLGGVPRRFPRGHYGFETDGPAGARVMMWSERE